jgi:hypothetical protein
MTAQDITAHDLVTFEDLKLLAAAKGPCITLLSVLPNPMESPIRLDHLVRDVKKALQERGVGAAISAQLVGPINELAITAEAGRIWGNALIIFRSPDVFRYYFLQRPLPESLSIADRFQVRPLLAVLTREQRFHLLGLSQQRIRLFHCTQHRIEEAELRGIVPSNMREWMNNRIPDHVLHNRSSAGPSIGSMKGVMFGTSTGREDEDDSLKHFLKEVNRGLHMLLGNDTTPLVLAGVEEEVTLYRRLNTYPRLLDKTVHGSPDGLPARILHERAREVVSQTCSEPLRKALADFHKQRDFGRVTFRQDEAIKAAFDGRVADLFMAENAERTGVWGPDAGNIQASPDRARQEDLLNAAALQTVTHGGRAFSLPASAMPENAEIAAVLRY